MTTPVCPACRSPLDLDAHVCSRCGLAVRPTCSNCGEALEARMHACPRCWEVIEQPQHISEGTVAYQTPVAELPRFEETVGEPTPVAAPTLTREVPVASEEVPVVSFEPYAYHERPHRRRGRFLRVLLIGLFSGLLAAGGLLVLDTFGPRLRGTLPDQVKLERQDFSEGDDADFAIGIPEGWTVLTDREDGQPVVTVREPSDGGGGTGLSSFQVAVDETSFTEAREGAGRKPSTAGDYRAIDIVDGIDLDGLRAFRHIYIDGDDYHERWWVDRGEGTYRLDFSSPISRREDAAQLNVRIARTFDVL